MARNPKQDANLKPFHKGDLTSEEAKKRGRVGGVKSGESRRAKRDAKSAVRYLLEDVYKRQDPHLVRGVLVWNGFDGADGTVMAESREARCDGRIFN